MGTHRVVIVGIGNAAKPHLAAIADLDRAELVGGSCRTPAKGEAFAKDHGVPWFDDVGRMLDEAKPDLAIVCTPSGAHGEAVGACADRGVHALCEKPLEITTPRIDAMVARCNEAGVTLGGVFQQRYNPTVRAVRDAAAEGRFGPLAIVSAVVPWWRDDAYYAPERWQGTAALDGGGALINQAIHAVDALQWLAAAALAGSGIVLEPEENPVDEVFAWTARRGHDPELIEVEDACVAVLRFKGGGLGQLLATTAMHPGSLRRLMIGGRGGTAQIAEDDLATFEFREEHDGDDDLRQRLSGGNDGKGGKGGAADPMAFSHANHRAMLADFLDALDAGRPPAISADEARKPVAIVEACYRSAASGKPEPVR